MRKKTSLQENPNYTAIIQTPCGKLGVVCSQFLIRLELVSDDIPLKNSLDPLVGQLVHELDCYFANPNFKFTIPYQVTGTTFQKRVWEALVRLPVGKTISYSGLAKRLKTGARAIGNACRTNPLLLLIPCHRVLAQNGLGGFSGDHTGKKVAVKQWLVNHEISTLNP
jgi:methylated-DNA-[protein]-cysteine S-methyltransferase